MARRHTPSEPQIQLKEFANTEEINKGIEKIKRRLQEVESLDPDNTQHDDPKVNVTQSKIRNTILEVFGPNSPEYDEHKYHRISEGVEYVGMSESASQQNFVAGVAHTREILKGLADSLEEKKLDFEIPVSIKQPIKISEEEKQIKEIRVFISYSNTNKKIGVDVKNMLEKFHIYGFLAHNDIEVSEEWKQRILEELNQANIFIAILSVDFKQSTWTSQEIGIAINRRVTIVPLRLDGTIPFGFIDHLQGGDISNGISLNVLLKPIVDKFPVQMIPNIIRELENIQHVSTIATIMGLVAPHFNRFDKEDIDRFTDMAINSVPILLAGKEKYLPEFISIYKDKIQSDKLKTLEYRIKNDEWGR